MEEPDISIAHAARLEQCPWTRQSAEVQTAIDSAPSTFSLSRFVEDVRVLESVPGQTFQVERLPDGRTTLYFRSLEQAGSSRRKGDVTVAGPRTRAHFKSATGGARVVVVQFKPGWSASLFGVAASALTDRMIHLEDLWGRSGKDLCDDLLETRSVSAVFDRISRAIAVRAQHNVEPASARLARQAVRLIEGDEIRMENVASILGVTARHLRRAFTESIGIGPKEFARAVRFQRAVRSSATSKDWARIATDAGYYDQAHLIGDFRELVGLTPSAFLKRASNRALPAKTARRDRIVDRTFHVFFA